MKRRIVAIFLAALLMGSAVGCGETAESEVTTVTVQTANPERGSISVASEFVGTVAPEDEVSVFPKVSGTVTNKNFEVGDTVQKGAVLFTIDDTNAKLTVDSASAAYEAAQASANAAQAGVDASEAQLAAAALGNEISEIQSGALADLQTDSTLKTLNDSLRSAQDAADTYNKQKKDLQENYTNLSNQISSLSASITNTKKQSETAAAAYNTAKSNYEKALSDSATAVQNLKNDAPGSATYDANKAAADAAAMDVSAKKTALDAAQKQVETLTSTLASLQTQLATANTSYKSMDSSVSSARLAEEQADTQVESIKENIRLTQETANLTKEQITAKQNEMHADSYAASQASVAASEAQAAAASAQAEAAGVQVAQAKEALSYYNVTAPIGGTIESISIRTNQMAQAGSPAYVISNKDNMVVTFNVTETVAGSLSLGDTITAERGDETFDGVITEIGGMASTQTKLFAIKASLGSVPGLSSGISVKVHAYTDHASNVLTVPYDCLYFQGGSSYVFVAEGGKAIRRTVTTGLMDDNKAEIIDGLGMDDNVIITWSSQLKDGSEITVAGAQSDKKNGSDTDKPAADEAAPEDSKKNEGTTAPENEGQSEGDTDTDGSDKPKEDSSTGIRTEDQNEDGSIGVISTRSFVATLSGGCITDIIAESEADR